MTSDVLPDVFLNDFAFCALAGSTPIAAGGIIPAWETWGYCWFVRGSEFNRRYWPGITRAVAESIEIAFERRLYAYVAMTIRAGAGDLAARSWARKLGFVESSYHEDLLEDGSPGWVYVRGP